MKDTPVMRATLIAVAAACLLPSWASAQLSGSVGPTTSRTAKANKKTCNILNYGGVASANSDNSAAITAAWNACSGGGEVYIPSGSYGLSNWVTLSGGNGVSINLEGVIYRLGTAGGTMIAVQDTTDFEFYSGNSKGAIQGYGYTFHTSSGSYGPRILRLISVTNFSFHDIALVDSPAFHLTLDTCSNGEVYNTIIRGGSEGGLDGIDVWGSNIWVHDVEVTNKDECVTVKSPANNILVQNIFCNWSGGSAIGSLADGTAISNVEYQNVYSQNCNQMFMLKSNGGNGTVKNVVLNNFQGHTNAYTLDLNGYWSSESVAPGNGVFYTGITFSNWKGTNSNGGQRGSIQVWCPAGQPCTDITISNFNIWTESGSEELESCWNAYGSGACLRSGSGGTYTTTVTVKSASNYGIQTMPGEISNWGLTTQIAIPPIPTSYFPGLTPISPLMAAMPSSSTGATTPTTTHGGTTTTTTTSKPTTTAAPPPSGGSQSEWGQCGGIGWSGPTACASPYTCSTQNPYYAQCV